MRDKNVIIAPIKVAPVLSPRLLLNRSPITGVVRGPDGRPLAGVNVVVKKELMEVWSLMPMEGLA